MKEKAKNLINTFQQKLESKRAVITCLMFALFVLLSALNKSLFLEEIVLCGFIVCSIMLLSRNSENSDY